MSIAALLKKIIRDNQFSPDSIAKLEVKLFHEGDRLLPYLVQFTVLLFLSTVIATYGIIQDSTATVIGAMLVAPLMTPILATTAALVMGRLKRVYASALIVLGGILIAIATSFFIGFLTVQVISVTGNSQISARISPNIDDLMVALAAGAVGAFATARDDVADSLPGVAIAIALVPPLAVVGLALSQGEFGAAWGAFLLFITNLLSILLAGGLVFALFNLADASIQEKDITKQAQRKAYMYIGIGILLVAIPLSLTTYKVTRDSIMQNRGQTAVNQWLDQTELEYELVGVKVFDNSMDITVAGADAPPSIEELKQNIQVIAPHFDDVVLEVNLSQEVPVVGNEVENTEVE